MLKDLKCRLVQLYEDVEACFAVIEKSQEKTQSNEESTKAEQLPLSSFYKVIDHVTIFRSEKWWEAIVVIESFGRRSIAMYLWQKRNDQWKRKHKFQIRNTQEWEQVKGAIDKLAPILSQTSASL